MAGPISTLLRALAIACALLLGAEAAMAQAPRASTPAELRSRYAALRPQLEKNVFRGPVYIESVERSRSGQGDVYAVVNSPFAAVSGALADPAQWCDLMILHLNTKYCRSGGTGGAEQLELRIGRKHDQPLPDAQRVLFAWRASPPAADFLHVQMDAAVGPFDTHDYRIVLEAVPLDAERSFIHLAYSFEFGTASHMAMRLYLSTIGRSKVGFTPLPATPGKEPEYLGGVRGMVERNTMRYYLAIEAFLGALTAPPAQRLEQRLQAWFDATEKYPRQLREIEREDYLAMKRREYRRQQAVQ